VPPPSGATSVSDIATRIVSASIPSRSLMMILYIVSWPGPWEMDPGMTVQPPLGSKRIWIVSP